MSEEDKTDTSTGTETKTFTQAEVDRIVADRLKREREKNAEKFGDYDELKAKAAAADSSKSEMAKLADRLAASEKKTAEMEAKALRAEVAQVKGLSAAQARRLAGATREELEADADDLLETFGTAAKKDEPKDDEKKDGKGKPAAEEASPFGRPRERLTSGAAPAAEKEPSVKDLANEVLGKI